MKSSSFSGSHNFWNKPGSQGLSASRPRDPGNKVGTTVSDTFVGTNLITVPSQFWLARLASRIVRNNIERGGEPEKDSFGLVVKCHNLTWRGL